MKQLIAVVILTLSSHILLSQNELKHEIYFETDSYQIQETEYTRLLAFITTIHKKKVKKIAIFGYCDDRGSIAYNLNLSKQRAKAIKNIFVKHDIAPNLITNVDGKGEVYLEVVKADNVSTIRGLNRKTEIQVTYDVPLPSQNSVANDTIHATQATEKVYENETFKRLESELKVGDKITLQNLYFKNGYSNILPESVETLNTIAKIMAKRDNIYFTIQGHVCCTYQSRDAIDAKTKKRNLSLARAKFVFDYLVARGVKHNRMRFIGLKRKFPLGGDPKFDRRVEFKITHIAKK